MARDYFNEEHQLTDDYNSYGGNTAMGLPEAMEEMASTLRNSGAQKRFNKYLLAELDKLHSLCDELGNSVSLHTNRLDIMENPSIEQAATLEQLRAATQKWMGGIENALEGAVAKIDEGMAETDAARKLALEEAQMARAEVRKVGVELDEIKKVARGLQAILNDVLEINRVTAAKVETVTKERDTYKRRLVEMGGRIEILRDIEEDEPKPKVIEDDDIPF